jgi:hypothetical protein
MGIIVFLGGVALLVFVFVLAYDFFQTDSLTIPLAPPNSQAPSAGALIGQSALQMIIKIALLVVMSLIGSMLASRGINLYFASAGMREERNRTIQE